MYKQKIGISLCNDHGIPEGEVIQIIKNAGFDAISPTWVSRDALARTVAEARRVGLEVSALHSSIDKAADMWERDPDVSSAVVCDYLESIDACSELSIPVIVIHAWIGFDYTFDGGSLNFGNFDTVVAHAREKNVKIAFENTEGLEYLSALMEHFRGDDTVGYCFDSGHEMCYNFSEDLLARWGERLYMTHLNDNLGIKSYEGVIFWKDDLHLMPYDGIADWDYNIERLRRARRQDILNFELKVKSKPERHENDVYMKMTPTEYYTEAYKRAAKIAYGYSR